MLDTKVPFTFDRPPSALEAPAPTPPRVRTVPGAIRRSLPAYSVLIGACEDGLPFLLDLQDASAGAVLVTGDVSSGKTRLLRSMVDSALLLNTAREVQVAVIAGDVDGWKALVEPSAGHGQVRGVYAPDSPEARSLVRNLAGLAEQRPAEDASGPAILLVIDGLEQLLTADYETQARLHWLIQNGPQRRVWPIVALNTLEAVRAPYWTDLFRTRLLGQIENGTYARRLAVRPGVPAQNLRLGVQFTAWLDGRWENFWLDTLLSAG